MGERERSVVLVSGGMDSLVTAAVALTESAAAFLHVSYGQRTEARERRAFGEIARYYEVEEALACSLPAPGMIGGSALVDRSIPVRTGGVDRSEVPASYVPFRNGQLLATAVAWAEVLRASAVYIGTVEEDSSGYPDCRSAFLNAFGEAVRLGTARGDSIRIVAPLIHASKKEIVRLGLDLGAPFHLSWSCYTEEEEACGRCDSCRLRLGAFRENGVTDPIRYAAGPGAPGATMT